jgi:hypothetical protein
MNVRFGSGADRATKNVGEVLSVPIIRPQHYLAGPYDVVARTVGDRAHFNFGTLECSEMEMIVTRRFREPLKLVYEEIAAFLIEEKLKLAVCCHARCYTCTHVFFPGE